MMKLITIYYLIFIFLFALFSTKLNASNDSIFIKADSLKNVGNYYQASLEYEKIIFLNDDKKVKIDAAYKKAQVLKIMNEFSQAQKTLEQADLLEIENDSIHFLMRQEIVLCAYLAGNFEEAESQALQITYYFNDSNFNRKIIPLRVLTLNELQRWSESKLLLIDYIEALKISKETKDSLFAVFNKVYDEKKIPHIVNLKTVQTMSAIVPGLGQVFTGYPGEGIMSFAFTASSLVFAGVAFWNAYYFTGYFAGLALFQKFYFGGIKRLEYLTEKRNYVEVRKFNNSAKDEILKMVKIYKLTN